ncbi:FKBP-type peptidyl-prolyl cis-trans isomerase [Salinibacterium sp. PAMC 21357]|uniref:FKBP-type peptidyl-prolyl cis-trans isomerase n=1 Tax=Salinibacterium sp. PAMC 21357 TaxID=1112215 RepID=UPI00192AFDC4|nr:peptidylprolyl isomerase [Salinibacterium sp. PAMC 21357]
MSVSKKRVFVRKLAVVALSAGVIVSLTGCANGPFDLSACSPLYPAGSNSALVSADGPLGDDPAAEFATPLIADSVQSQELVVGDGEQVSAGDIASVNITIYSGATGEQLTSSGHGEAGLLAPVVEQAPHFGQVAQCSTVGSRVVTVGTAGQILGAESIAQNQLPLTEDDAIVMVSDIELRYPGKADGTNSVPPAGLPAVVLAPNGQPGFTFPTAEDPTELKVATLKVGSGAVVKSGDIGVMHVSGLDWNAKKTFMNTWEGNGVPQVFALVSSDTVENGLPPALADALIGQTVGSQVQIVLPPDVGFTEGTLPEGATAGKTLVFVFDILGIQEP